MNFSRRSFLKVAGAGVGALALPAFAWRGLFAQEAAAATRSLVVIYLRGGADALNIVVPFADSRYYELRPSIAIAPEAGGEGAPVIRLDKQFGLHPSLGALKPHFDAARLAPIVCTGSPHTTRSHFDAQDFMEYGAPGSRTVRDGWLNRYLNATNKAAGTDATRLRAVAMQSLLPRSLRGEYPVLAVPDDKVLNDGKLIDLFDDVYKDGGKQEGEKNSGEKKDAPKDMMGERREEDSVKQTGKDTVETLKRYKEILKRPMEGKRATFGVDKFGRAMRDIATCIRANVGLEVASVDVGGWDDHVNEGGAEGALAQRLKTLGDNLAAFLEDLGPRAESTLVYVMTEFGRTCKENGNEGTDHGHGGCAFLLGGKVKGGKVHGQWSGLAEKDLYQKRDLPITTDYRDVFATVLAQHMKFEVPKGFFPDYSPKAVAGLF